MTSMNEMAYMLLMTVTKALLWRARKHMETTRGSVGRGAMQICTWSLIEILSESGIHGDGNQTTHSYAGGYNISVVVSFSF